MVLGGEDGIDGKLVERHLSCSAACAGCRERVKIIQSFLTQDSLWTRLIIFKKIREFFGDTGHSLTPMGHCDHRQ